MFWFFLIIYLIPVFIGIAIANRYAKDHSGFTDSYGYIGYSDVITGILFWPISIPILIIVLIFYGIYKTFYYVVDKIYTKVVSCLRRREEKTN